MKEIPGNHSPQGGEEISPPLSLYSPVVKSESMAHLKWGIFETAPTDPLLKEQPHGVDLWAKTFLEVDKKTGKVGGGPYWAKENPLDGMAPERVTLGSGKTYFVLVSPALKRPYRNSQFIFHLFPKSTLHRVGIAAVESTFYGTANENQMNTLGLISEAYEDGRQAAMQIRVLNPNDVTIENLAPFIQAVLERMPEETEKNTAAEQDKLFAEQRKEKQEPLHLGRISEFLPEKPVIARDPKKSKLNVTKPLTAKNGAYTLKAHVPYILETQENVTMTKHEMALTRAFAEEEKPIDAYGEALVDAGYKGKLTYLIMPKEDVTLHVGEEIGYLLRITVPTTEEPYKGQWK